MEEETRIIFKGSLEEFEDWIKQMSVRYGRKMPIEAILDDFKTTE